MPNTCQSDLSSDWHLMRAPRRLVTPVTMTIISRDPHRLPEESLMRIPYVSLSSESRRFYHVLSGELRPSQGNILDLHEDAEKDDVTSGTIKRRETSLWRYMFVDTSTGSDGVALHLSVCQSSVLDRTLELVGAPQGKRRRGETVLVNCSVRDTLTHLVTEHPDYDTTRRAALKI